MSKKEIRLSVLELERLGVALVFPQCPDTKAEENSRSLVACWNACEGISTERLEDNLLVKELVQQNNEAIRQRDLLLAALDRIVWSRKLGEKPSKHVEAMERVAINAIANAKGGAA